MPSTKTSTRRSASLTRDRTPVLLASTVVTKGAARAEHERDGDGDAANDFGSGHGYSSGASRALWQSTPNGRDDARAAPVLQCPPMSPTAPSPAAALVTGASRGLGRGIARGPGRDGLDVAIHYGATRAAAEETVAACRRLATACRPEVRRSSRRHRDGPTTGAASSRRPWPRFGRIDALVNNAGIAPRVRADILEATEESFDELIAVNLKGPYFLSQLVARHWLERPRPVARCPAATSWCSSPRPPPPAPPSIAATTACPRRAWPWRPSSGPRGWPRDGVQVYELRPGIMATDMTAGVKEKYDRMIAEGLVPQGRWGTAEDVGLAVSALLKGQLPLLHRRGHQRRRRAAPARGSREC